MPKRQPVGVLYLVDKIGTGGVASHLVQVLEHLDRAKFRPVVCCVAGRAARDYDPPGHDRMIAAYRRLGAHVEVLHLECIFSPRYWRQWLRLVKLIERHRIAVAHMYLFSSILSGTAATLLTGGVARVAARRESGQWWMKPQHRWAMRVAQGFCAAVTANTAEIAGECLGIEKLPPNKLHLIYNGIDAEGLRRQMSEAAPLPLPGVPGRRIGMVANLVPIKGHAVLLEAMASVVRAYPDATLLLVGDGPLKETLAQQVQRLGLTGRVHFLGRLPAARALGGFDVAVQSSLSEGGSNTALEYLAAALPAALPAVGANAELLRHRQTACLFAPGDAQALAGELLWLLGHPGEARRIGEAGRGLIDTDLNARAMVARMEALYTRILEAA